MEFGCCTTIENYGLLVKNGYDRIILPAADIAAMDALTFERTRKTLEQGPVTCQALNSFCTPRLRLCGPEYSEQTVTAYSRLLADRAARLGVRQIGVGAPQSRSIPDDFSRQAAMEQFKRSLTAMCRVCRAYDIDILLEAVCSLECNFVTTTDEAQSIVSELGLDNLKLVYDTYHASMMGEDDIPLRRAMQHVRLVHVAQEIGGGRHYLRRENIRDYKVYFDALLESGYDGEISVEAFYDDIGEQLAETLGLMRELCSPAKR